MSADLSTPGLARAHLAIAMGLLLPATALLAQPAEPEPTGVGALPPEAGTMGGGRSPTVSPLTLPAPENEDALTPTPRRFSRTTGDNKAIGTTVRARQRPDYDPVGVKVGSFTLLPQASVQLGYDSNVFAQENGKGDAYAQGRLDATLRSDWARHAVTVDGFVNQRVYTKYSSEDRFTYRAHIGSQIDIGRDDGITADLRQEHVITDRSSVGELLSTLRPTRYDLTAADLGARIKRGRFAAELSGNVSRYDYANARTPAGAPLDQQFRDYRRSAAQVDLGYSFGGGRQIFVSASGERRRYRIDSVPLRDSNSYEFLTGLRSDITPLLRGQIGFGYIHADFRDPTIKSRGALAIDTRLDYLVTELTTVSVSGRRFLQDVASVTSAGAITTQFKLSVDHELLRNLILSVSGIYDHANYVDSPKTATTFSAKLGADWLINRNMRANFNLGGRRRNSTEANRDYREFVADLGLTFRL